MDLGLAGARALVTGGSRGVGRAIAERLLAEGASVAICARNQEGVDEAVAELGKFGTVIGQAFDVGQHDVLAEWVQSAARELGGIDVVVSNASALGGIPRSPEGWRRSLEIDVLSAITVFDAAHEHLEESDRAALLQVSTITAVEYHGYPGGGMSYGAMKAALINWVKQVAIEYAADGIRANAISPGPIFIEGGSWDRIKAGKPDYYAANLAVQPQGRFGTAEEVANLAVFLSSPAASWVTGENVVVDGGFTKRHAF